MTISTYADLQLFLKNALGELNVDAEFSPHGAFWSSLTYSEFVDGNVPEIAGAPVRIVVRGDASASPLVQALKGEGMFSPGGRFRRMPGGGPFLSEAQIAEISNWINAGCPE